jgi:hypothetical protein
MLISKPLKKLELKFYTLPTCFAPVLEDPSIQHIYIYDDHE